MAAVLGFNLFFLPPVGKLTIEDPQNWVALAAFLVTAVTASQLSAHARRRAAEAEARRVEIERLYALVQSMMLTGSARKTIREFVNRVVQVFGCTAAAFYYRSTTSSSARGRRASVVSDHESAGRKRKSTIFRWMPSAAWPSRRSGSACGRWAAWRSSARLPSEQMVRAIVNLIAITIEKARALEDASHAEAARQSEVLKSALLDSLAHDIKTPLTSIKAAVTSLLGSAPDTDRELLTIINEEADRLNQLAAEVVEMARIEAGKLHLEKQPVAVAELISGGALRSGAAAQRAAAHAATFRTVFPPAEADRDFAGQVVKQFVENALKYSPEGSPLDISAELQGGKIVIGVADRGPGIEENERSRIFDKFYPRTAAPFRHHGNRDGTGHRQGNRGSARRENLGGKRAGPGRGILFLAGRERRRPRNLSAGRILVVDDDPQIRRVMKATLVGHGYEVIEARTGEDALETIPRRCPT